jgi:uncharacterized protein (DUF1697 family)
VLKYVAFLRGINVGGRTIKMTDLEDCLRGIGFDNVKTILQTGNVAFESSENISSLKLAIETSLKTRFNYDIKAQVYEFNFLKSILLEYPFDRFLTNMQNYIIFTENDLEEELVKEKYVLEVDERVSKAKGLVNWQIRRGSSVRSNFYKYLTKSKYKNFNTVRSINTIERIIDSNQ